jgi:RNA ligase (TIGR02306 family)
MKLASIETVLEKEVHPNADLLEIVKVQGWRSVVRKAENYQVGDKVIFIPIDTVVQPAAWNTFLQKTVDNTKPIRVDTVRLRGVFSQGLIQPLSILPSGEYEVGQEVHELIGVSKYEREIPAQLAGLAKGNFPYHIIPKTDEENLLSTPELLDEIRGHEVYVSLKMDGSSCSLIDKENEEFMVCSRSLNLKESEGNSFWVVARKYDLPNKMKGLNIAIQGELCGENIQSNQAGIKGQEFRLFNGRFLDTGRDMGLQDLIDIAKKLEIPMVDVIKTFKIDDSTTISDLQTVANEVKYQNGKPGEGIVVRPAIPFESNVLRKSLSFKVINQNYKQ